MHKKKNDETHVGSHKCKMFKITNKWDDGVNFLSVPGGSRAEETEGMGGDEDLVRYRKRRGGEASSPGGTVACGAPVMLGRFRRTIKR
jgi:hypothetical protein